MLDSDLKAIQEQAAAIAREAWKVKPGQISHRWRLRIPSDLKIQMDEQDTDERGQRWVEGCLLQNKLDLIYQVLTSLSGASVSIIVSDDVTLVLGQNAFTAKTQLEAILQAFEFYAPLQKKKTVADCDVYLD